MMFGGITVVCGILGSIAGGVILDYMNSTISNAFKVSVLSALSLTYLPLNITVKLSSIRL